MTAYFDSSSMLPAMAFLAGVILSGIVVHAITSAYWREREHNLRRLLEAMADKVARMRSPINLDGDEQAYKQIRERV